MQYRRLLDRIKAHKAVASDTGYVMASQFILRGTLNLSTIAAANYLTVAGFTAYNYFYVTANLISAFLSLGLPIASSKWVIALNIKDAKGKDESVCTLLLEGLKSSLPSILSISFTFRALASCT